MRKKKSKEAANIRKTRPVFGGNERQCNGNYDQPYLRNILNNQHFIFVALLTLHYIQRPSSSKIGFSRMSHDPCEVFSTTSRLQCREALRLERLFWTRNKVGCSFGFGLWAWPLEASHFAAQRLHFLYFIGYFQLISLDSQQTLATQSHGLSTWMAKVRSGPKQSHTNPFGRLLQLHQVEAPIYSLTKLMALYLICISCTLTSIEHEEQFYQGSLE